MIDNKGYLQGGEGTDGQVGREAQMRLLDNVHPIMPLFLHGKGFIEQKMSILLMKGGIVELGHFGKTSGAEKLLQTIHGKDGVKGFCLL